MKKRKNIFKISVLFAMLFAVQLPASAQMKVNDRKPQFGVNSIQQVISAMTLKQKAKLVVGMGISLPPGVDSTKVIKMLSSAEGINFIPLDPEAAKVPRKVPGAAGRTHPLKKFGIPSITVSDGPAGVRIPPIRNHDSSKTYYTTGFPRATLLASTWDPAVAKNVGAALGSEALEYGIDYMLMPAMDIQRNPLNGRNFEYYSEDPLLTGRMAAAMVEGVQSNGVGATIKHFAANNEEANRMTINEKISKRTLRETYLRGFEIAVKKSHPWAVMSSYNKVNGTYTSQNKGLLTAILRNEWGFDGFVMTDWFGGKDPVAQIEAGNDLMMPGSPGQSKRIVQAVKEGRLSVHALNLSVRRILEGIMKTPEFHGYDFSNQPDLKKDAQIARQAATQGMVLLKNEEHGLPLKKGHPIALFGNRSYNLLAGGYGSGEVNTAYKVSLEEGLKNSGYQLDTSLRKSYKHYIAHEKAVLPEPKSILAPPTVVPEMPVSQSVIQEAAKNNDVAIITISQNSGESRDLQVDDFYLSQTEKSLIQNVSDAFHARGKNVIVVLNIANPIEIVSWRDEVDGILLAWMPGQEGGNAMADILSGEVNPSGKLAQTFPVDYSDVPSADYFPGTPENDPEQVVYGEGIYVGYRYYNTFDVKTAYPFGYGLSYTNFTYSDLKLSSKTFNQGVITASVTVTNSGDVPGKEVAELYLGAPTKVLRKPSEELKGFAKTRLLQPGESQTFTFTLSPMSLASFNPAKEAWIAGKGKYMVKIGASCADIRQTASFTLDKSLLVEKVHPVLESPIKINAYSNMKYKTR